MKATKSHTAVFDIWDIDFDLSEFGFNAGSYYDLSAKDQKKLKVMLAERAIELMKENDYKADVMISEKSN